MRLALAISTACVGAALLPAGAGAAVNLTNVKLTPTTTTAGGHPNVAIDLSFSYSSSSDDLKSIALVLPQGLVGDPNAADRCTQADFTADQCPGSSKVGTQAATAQTILGPQNVPGDVYNLRPQGKEPARLGVVLRPAIGSKVFLQSGISTGPGTNFGLASKFDNLPRNSPPLDIQLTAMKLTLNGAAAHGKFLTNPTDCRPARTVVAVTSYDQPATPKTGTSSFTPTGCASLPFAPRLSGSIGGAGGTGANKSPTLTAIVAARPGDANARRVAVALPPQVGINLKWPGTQCPGQTFAAGNCPAQSRVGTAIATSPLLATPVTGPVSYITAPGSTQPALGVQFGPPVPLQLVGRVGFGASSITNTFDNIPDLPLSRFQLTIAGGGTRGLLTNGDNLCRLIDPPVASGQVLAHSGRSANLTALLPVRGCVPGSTTTVGGGKGRPRGTLSLRFNRHHVGSLSARFFRRSSSAPKLKRLRLSLPKRLRTGARHGKLPRRFRVTAGGRRLGRKSVKLRGHLLDVRLRGRTASSIRLRWGAIQPSRSLARRLAHRPRLTFLARVTDTRRTTRLGLTVRPAVKR